jgi:hemerythrin
MIAWTPSLAVGIEEIDAQHKELFRAADAFLTSVENCTPAKVAALLAYLRSYANTHFSEEEGWMREFSFPEFALHKAQHERFLRDLDQLAAVHRRHDGTGLEPMRVATWLGRWLIDHVSASDTRLAHFIVSRSA